MKPFYQGDERWKNIEFVPGFTLGKYGCLIVSLASILEIEPPDLLPMLKGCIDKSGSLVCSLAAKNLGITYQYIKGKQSYPNSIWETNYFAPLGFPQHFVVHISDNRIMDPLNYGKTKNCQYYIVSTRIFHEQPGA